MFLYVICNSGIEFVDIIYPACKNTLAASNFATYSQLFLAYFTLDFLWSILGGRETQSLLPTTST